MSKGHVDNKLFKTGDVIQCPRCGREIAKFTRDIMVGQVFGSEDVKWSTYSYRNFEPTVCKTCGAPWGLAKQHNLRETMCLHLSRGWVPKFGQQLYDEVVGFLPQ